MNASVHLLHRCLPATVHLRATIGGGHASAAILGEERMGTGVLLRGGGLAITAHYVVIGATSVEATLLDGSTVPARVLGIDYEAGLAALSVDAPGGARLRSRGDAETGEEVFLVASVGDGRRVSSGCVSSAGPFEAFWEYALDRAITVTADTPGLPGGPVFDRFGQIAAIVALSLAEVGKFTLGIPVSVAMPLLREVERTGGFVRRDTRAWIGITCYPLRHHVVVAGVLPSSPADRAGLRAGDVLLAVDGEVVPDRRALYGAIWRHRSGESLRIRLLRDESALELEVFASAIEDYFR